ncbi:MAG: hypothetical protein ACPGED_09050, partial [Flavobacteriales bacterium]
SSLLQRNFKKHNILSSIVTSEEQFTNNHTGYQINRANQSLDTWTKNLISEGDIVLFLLRESTESIDPEIQNKINEIPHKKGQQRWICVECETDTLFRESKIGLRASRIVNHMKLQYDQIAQAIHQPEIHLKLYNLDSEEIAGLALVSALKHLSYNLSSVSCNTHNHLISEMISNGLSQVEILEQLSKNKKEQNRFWVRTPDKKVSSNKLESYKSSSASQYSRFKIPLYFNDSLTVHDHSSHKFIRTYKIQKASLQTDESISDWLNKYEELKVQFIKLMLKMESEYSSSDLVIKV